MSPDEAALDIIEEELQPFFDQVERYHELGMAEQEATYSMAVILGIYRFEHESKSEFKKLAEDLPAHLRSVAAGSPLVLLDVLEDALDRGVLTLGSEGWKCQNPATLVSELEALRAGRTQPIESHPRSLLVVPLASTPGDDVERWSDALTEDLIVAPCERSS